MATEGVSSLPEEPEFARKEFSEGPSRGSRRPSLRVRPDGGIAGTVLQALLVMGFPGAAECCNYIAAHLKDGLLSSP